MNTDTDIETDADLLAQATAARLRDLLRLEALETVSASKLSLPQAEELADLKHRYGATYERKLKAAQEKFAKQLAESPRFEALRTRSNPQLIREQLEAADKYQLPEKVSLINPQQMMEIRALLANRLNTVSALRRHAARMAGQLEGDVSLAEEMWMGMSPADREWRMKGEMAELLDAARSTAREHKLLAGEADGVYWNLIRMLDTVQQISKDWDSSRSMDSGGQRDGLRGAVTVESDDDRL